MRSDPPPPAQTSRPQAATPTPNLYLDFMHQAEDDNRGLKISLLVAAVIHGALLLITFPNLYSEELIAEAEPKQYMKLSPPPRFKQQPPPPTEVPKERTKRIPMPDPEPDDPEPVRVDTPQVDIPLPEFDGLPLAIPDRPPEPEPPGPIHLGSGVERPVRINYVAPQYTEMARRIRLEGIVILQTVIGADGRVEDVKVLKGMNFGITESAVAAVKQWTYKPATVNGKPVAVYLNLTVNFTLQ